MFARSASALLLRLSGARRSMYCELHEGKRFNSLDTSYLLLHTRLPGEDPPWPSCQGNRGGILTIMWVAGAWRALLCGLCAGACIYNVFCCAEITQSCLLSIQNRLSTRLEIFNIPGIFPSPGPTANWCGDGLLLIDTWCDFMIIMTCPRVAPSPRKAGRGGLAAVPGLVGNLLLVPGDGAWSRLGGHRTPDTGSRQNSSSREKLLAPGHEK